jgi:hypothetical protein
LAGWAQIIASKKAKDGAKKARHLGAGERSVLQSRHWTVDRRLPIALLLAIAVQSATVAWWAATLSTRIEGLEKRQEAVSSQGERLVRVEESVNSLKGGIQDLKLLLLTPPITKPRPDESTDRGRSR